MHAVLPEVQCLQFLAAWRKGRTALRHYDAEGQLRQGIHPRFFRSAIHQHARGADHVVRWYGDVYVEAAELTVEFALCEVGHGVPTRGIIDRRLWEPLCAVVGLPRVPKTTEAPIRDLHTEGRGDGDALACVQRSGQRDPSDVGVLRMIAPSKLRFATAEIQAVDVATIPGLREVEVEVVTGNELLAERGALVAVSIGPKVDPDRIEGLRAVVGVREAAEGVQHVRPIIEPHLYLLVDLLLPVGLRLRAERQGRQ